MKNILLLAFGLAGAGFAVAQTPVAIDLNTGSGPPTSSFPRALIARPDGVVLFQACTPEQGCELWRSNGTLAGTTLVLDIHPGPNDSSPASFGISDSGTVVYFSADDGSHGRELWRSDGTAAGTLLVRDIELGVSGSDPRSVVGVTGGDVLFTAGTVASGREIYRSNGVTATLVVDLTPGTGSGIVNTSGSEPDLTRIGTRVIFSGGDGEPFLTDGTGGGTQRLKDIVVGSGGSQPTDFTAYGSDVVFVADTAANGRELYRSNFTDAGTVRVSDVAAAGLDGVYHILGVAGSVALVAGTNGSNGAELYGYNGTTTALVKELNTGAADGLAEFPIQGGAVTAGPHVYFAGASAADGEELWRSDGTLNGTTIVAELLPGTASSSPRGLATLVQGATTRVVFVPGFDGSSSIGPLFITDGTPGGLVNLDTYKNIDPGNEVVQVGTGAGAYLMFGALGSSPLGETELWRSNGSAVGTVLLSDIATLTGSGLPSTPIVAGSRAFFSAYESTSGRELYVTRGTAATNGRVIDLLSGTASSIPGDGSKFDGSFLQGVALGDKLVYMADTLGFGLEPHVSDGTANGTLRLADVNPGPEASSLRAQVVTGNRVLMVLDNGVSSTLWATDGNVAGTEQVPLPCELLSDSQLTAVDTRAYFRCTEATTGEELYRIESSPPAVTRVADLTVGPESSDLTLLGPAGRPARLAFLEAASGRRLMLTDGSVAGTTVLNSSATRDYKTLPPLIDGDGASYLRGSDTGGETVFRINAALTAVTVLSTYPSLPIPEQINGEVQSASRCSFQFGAGQTNEGYELLRFNTVSQNGGFLAPTLQPGALSSELGDMVSLPGSDRYYASALADVDGGLGVELLRIDGNGDSAAVTSIDMVAGSRSSAPRNLATLGQTLLMSAWSPSVGRELFVLAAPDRIFGHGMNDGCGTLP